jgi:hypothetical protein
MFQKLQDVQNESEVEEKLAKFIPEVSGIVKESLMREAPEMLSEKRAQFDQFTLNNQKRWQKGFDSLETHIVICTEVGESINNECRAEAVENEDIVFDLVVRFHARASHISQEILCLLKNGFADAAHARWRALHEVNVTAMFIAKHGHECARRFWFTRKNVELDHMRPDPLITNGLVKISTLALKAHGIDLDLKSRMKIFY